MSQWQKRSQNSSDCSICNLDFKNFRGTTPGPPFRCRPRNTYFLPHIQGGRSTPLCLFLFGNSVIMGDFNIDLLKLQTHGKTNDFIESIDVNSVLSNECPNSADNTFLHNIIYKHAYIHKAFPLKNVKKSRRYIKRQPWITQGILNSSINKCRLLRAKIRNQTVHNITIYKN